MTLFIYLFIYLYMVNIHSLPIICKPRGYSKQMLKLIDYKIFSPMRESRRGDRGSGPPLSEKSQNIGFLSNTGPDHLKITKL